MMKVDQRKNHLVALLAAEERSVVEGERMLRLLELFAGKDPPPDWEELFPAYPRLQEQLRQAMEGDDGERLEEAFLELYSHLHMHEAPYTPSERQRVRQTGGYWCHAGGISPVLKAGEWIQPPTISADFGAGNGLQALLLQWLYPHARTRQIEISQRMSEIGRQLQRWLEIPSERVEWVVADVVDVRPQGLDFIYLYRPVRPEGEGLLFYQRFAETLRLEAREVVIFSIADCLRDFLDDRFVVFYHDGHLTCYRS